MSKKLLEEDIKKYVEENSECKFIEHQTVFKGGRNRHILTLQCKCGTEFSANFDSFKNNNQKQCLACSYIIKHENSKYGCLTKEDYIKIVQNKYKELNKTPKQSDFKGLQNLPSSKTIISALGVTTWNEALQLCGVGKTKERYYNVEKSLYNLKELINKLGYIPTKDELSKLNVQPSVSWFNNKFGSYENTLNKIGFTRETTNEDLINILKEFHFKNGKSPTTKDMCAFNNLPSTEIYYGRFNTMSWNKILEMAGLELNHFQGYTKEFAIVRLKEYVDKFNKLPTREEYEFNNWTPYWDFYYRKFSSFEYACYEAGLCDKPLNNKERKEISINELQALAKKLNRCPSVAEYENLKHRGICRRELEKYLKLKYNDICRKFIPEYKIINTKGDATKEELLQDLIDLRNDLGRNPYSNDLVNSNSRYSLSVYYRVFNKGFIDILNDELGWDIKRSSPISKSRQGLLEDFYKLFIKLGRIPYCRDIDNEKGIASYQTYSIEFKNIKNICDELDVDYEKNYKNAGAGKICLDKLGGMCRSIAEKNISNFFIDNDIEFEKEVLYKSVLLDDNGLRRFDFVINFNNTKYYIEYFGLYSKNPRGHIGKRYYKKTRKKIKDLYKSGLVDQCIFIFPRDMKCNKNESLQQKLESFLLEKYNIDIKNSNQQ